VVAKADQPELFNIVRTIFHASENRAIHLWLLPHVQC
jgi:hypothetical protein